MPITSAFSEPSTFVARAAGKVTYGEVMAFLDHLRAHPRLADARSVLVDARDVSGAPDTDELREIARALQPLLSYGLARYAVVTGSDFVYGVARMFSVFAELMDINVGAFRDMDEAKAWLVQSTGRPR